MLAVWFAKTGKPWDHFAVPVSVYEALIASEGPGRFYGAEIRNRYPTKRHRRLKSEMAA